jgi:hypothetical protein
MPLDNTVLISLPNESYVLLQATHPDVVWELLR